MYNSRVVIAIEQREQRCRNAGMFVVMPPSATRIVPDMTVLCLDREQVLSRVDAAHPTVGSALAMFDRTDDDSKIVVFGVLFPDGGIMANTLQVHNADRDRV